MKEPHVQLDTKNRAGLIGRPCDFYVYLEIDGKSYYSNWIKGPKASNLWFTFRNLAKVKSKIDFFKEAKRVYNEVGPIQY